MDVQAVSLLPLSSVPNCQYPLLASIVENIVLFPEKLLSSSIPCVGYESRWGAAFNFLKSMQKRKVPSFLATKIIVAANFDAAGLMTSSSGIFAISER